MRIVAGSFKGTKLYAPTDKKTRPLKDMVKESVFNFLMHSKKILFQIEHSNILDLYSGTGSFGLECLSRKAQQVIFIEKEKEAIKILKKNIQKLKGENKTKIYFNDVINIIKEPKKNSSLPTDLKFDLIFCDPPFKETNINKLIELIITKDLLKKNGIIIFHRHKNAKDQLTNCFKIIDERIYGISKIIFGQLLS